MRITDAYLQSGAADNVRRAAGVKPASQENPSSAKVKKDSVSISSEGKDLAKSGGAAAAVQAHAEALPEVREERITEVRSRIQSGYYNTPEFQDKLAEKLMDQFGS